MNGWEFWATAMVLAGGVAAVLIAALRRNGRDAAGPVNADMAVYKDQLAEISRDLARGTIDTTEAERLRAEVGRRLLDADRGRADAALPADTGRTGLTMALVLAAALPGALGLYWWLGAPGYPDMPLGPRVAQLDAGIAARPVQEAELERLGQPRDKAKDDALRAELAAMTDPDALRSAFETRFKAGEILAALRTQERLLAVLGDKSQASDHANLALTLVLEAQGYVSPEAETSLRETLRRDTSNELARYLVGEMFLQGGRFDQTFRFWRPILENGSPAAPWAASIRDRIEMVAGLAGIRYQLPEQEGPSEEDMAAAADMTPDERQAMIEGMVAQLSDLLATEGGDIEDWDQLIRSLAVLKRLNDAQTIYDEAKIRFEGRPAELSFLRLAAVESGLNP